MIIPADDDKARVFGAIVYPDSVVDNWQELLLETGYKIAISPLHDLDRTSKSDEDLGITVDDNGYLKPHYHVIIRCDGPTFYRTIKDRIINPINAYKHGIVIASLNGAFTYLTHESYKALKDGKHIYSADDIVYLNSTKYDFVKCDFADIVTIIEDNKIYTLTDLIKYLRRNNMNSLFEFVSKKTYYVNIVLADMREQQAIHMENRIMQMQELLNQLSGKMPSNELKEIMNKYENLKMEFYVDYGKSES